MTSILNHASFVFLCIMGVYALIRGFQWSQRRYRARQLRETLKHYDNSKEWPL